MRMMMKRCVVLGLLGGIGSGKSTVARLFAEAGAKVLDADAICRELHATAAVKRAIRERWGDEMFGQDGELNRRRMADRVFSEPEELKELERLLHPKVVERVKAEVEACQLGGGPELCVIDAPLLIESGLAELCDATVFVECEAAERVRRLAENRGWTPVEIKRREAMQESLARKREQADFVVVNSGDLATTRACVQKVAAHFSRSGD